MARRRHLAAAALLGLALAALPIDPTTGTPAARAQGIQDDVRLGQKAHPEIVKENGGVYDDPDLTHYVDSIGQLLAQTSQYPNIKWTFTIVNSDEVNAFATAGGYVYITRGIVALADDEAELAAVMGHEMGHITARHTASRQEQSTIAGIGATILGVGAAVLGVPGADAIGNLAGLGAQAYLASYSRGQELEADQRGVSYISRVGYDPTAMARFLQKLEMEKDLMQQILGTDGAAAPSYLSTHPPTPERVQKASAEAAGIHVRDPMVARDIYLRKIEGVIYGDDPKNGLVRGRVFSHPSLRIRFQVPPGFHMINTDAAVVGLGPDQSRIIFDMAAPGDARRDPADYIRRTWAPKLKIGLRDVETIDVNGMDGATGVTRASMQGKPVDARLIAIRAPNGLFRFMFITPPAQTGRLREGLERTTFSFRTLSPREAAALKPFRIHVVSVRRGDTVQSLAERMPFEDHRLERFLVLNGLRHDSRLEPGEKVKLVVE